MANNPLEWQKDKDPYQDKGLPEDENANEIEERWRQRLENVANLENIFNKPSEQPPKASS